MFCLLQAGIGSEEVLAQDSTPETPDGSVRFGIYEIDSHADGSLCELGRGAMGVTYRATDTSLEITRFPLERVINPNRILLPKRLQ